MVLPGNGIKVRINTLILTKSCDLVKEINVNIDTHIDIYFFMGPYNSLKILRFITDIIFMPQKIM